MRLANLGLLAASAALLLACPAQLDDRCADGACDPRADPPDAAASSGGDPCVADPSAPSCLDDATALFVSYAKGDDANEGTKAKPFKSIEQAITNLTSTKRRVYVCTATYAEDVVISNGDGPVTLLGGFDCDWNPVDTKPLVGAGVIALRIKNASAPVVVSRLAFHSVSSSNGSSIAAFVVGSTVTFDSVELVAGDGAPGASRQLAPYTYPSPADLAGKNGAGSLGGAGGTYDCHGQTTRGGAGGAAGVAGASGDPHAADHKNGGTGATCGGSGGGTGGSGDDGDEGPNGDGATVSGTLDESGWTPASGSDGSDGEPGQGGGGGFGAGGVAGHEGGGGGGAGGCGGAGGLGGTGGGASIALAVVGSAVTVRASALKSGHGGAGGDGGAGQAGQTSSGQGGVHDLSGGGGSGCGGGPGGKGGPGGAGGGGAGGLSAPIVYSGGTAPDADETTQRLFVSGAPGAGGAGGDGSTTGPTAGVTPQATPIFQAK